MGLLSLFEHHGFAWLQEDRFLLYEGACRDGSAQSGFFFFKMYPALVMDGNKGIGLE